MGFIPIGLSAMFRVYDVRYSIIVVILFVYIRLYLYHDSKEICTVKCRWQMLLSSAKIIIPEDY